MPGLTSNVESAVNAVEQQQPAASCSGEASGPMGSTAGSAHPLRLSWGDQPDIDQAARLCAKIKTGQASAEGDGSASDCGGRQHPISLKGPSIDRRLAKFDMIVGTDVIFATRLVPPLLRTMHALSREGTEVWLCMQERCAAAHALLLAQAHLYFGTVENLTQSLYEKPPP